MSSNSGAILLRAPRVDECDDLTDLCLRSKAVWGYDAAFMNACRSELTVTPLTLEQSRVQVAEVGGRLLGFVELKIVGERATLEKLFVDPAILRSGAGRRLFEWARAEAAAYGAEALFIESDPEAADFYRCMGAKDDGRVESVSIAGRFIPKLKLSLRA